MKIEINPGDIFIAKAKNGIIELAVDKNDELHAKVILNVRANDKKLPKNIFDIAVTEDERKWYVNDPEDDDTEGQSYHIFRKRRKK